MSENIDTRNYEQLSSALSLVQHIVYKRYLSELSQYPVVEPTQILKDETPERCLRFLKLEEFSCKTGEDTFQKLSTIYHASMALGCNLVVMIDVERSNAPANIYIGVRNEDSGELENSKSLNDLRTSYRTLQRGLESNFPGTTFQSITSQEKMNEMIEDIFGENTPYISSVSCVASIRDKSKTEHKNFIQGIEKLIDGMRGHTYTALFLAEPVKAEAQSVMRNGYETLFSTLSSFCKSVWSYNENESASVMESLSEGISEAITEGTSHTQAHTFNVGINLGLNASQENSRMESFSQNKPTNVARIGNALAGVSSIVGMLGSSIIPGAGIILPLIGGIGSAMQGSTTGSAIAQTIGNTIGKSFGLNTGYANTKSNTNSESQTKTSSDTKTKGTTQTEGTGRTLQIEHTNKAIEEILKRIEEQLKRTQEAEDYGSYSCGAYFISGKQESSVLAANTYRALMLGEGSSVESGAINSWNGRKEQEKVLAIKTYLSRFVHPIFAMPISENEVLPYTAGTFVSGLELPLHLSLPTKSVYGLPVIEHAEFGRNIVQKGRKNKAEEDTIPLGNIYHMGKIEKEATAFLAISTLSSHTFITGSTGSGKSNTIYKMLEELRKKQVKFLVVEPAKGEYKTIIGQEEDVTVYGTNPTRKDSTLLQINPFAFSEHIHILEHLDRLVEIFNVCWPMYAAMPAILKEAIERAYIEAGWDLINSTNQYDKQLFPNFKDVLRKIEEVLEESSYSSDSKGDYIGALMMRVKSLTNGINGLIFASNGISDEQLFDKNVIIDLSRVGSIETKSFIMGIIVLKLQEYRMAAETPNAALQHVTVLEEAHHLLRRTSLEQSTESANLLGKSVEMLANSIAEMRTYGEGFIIADQAPGLLDMSVIRNTNTKIILRLPDYSDRELVGRAIGLDDNQINELAKLEQGVATVYQSDWLEPVLCKVEEYKWTLKSVKNKSEQIEMIVPIETVKQQLLEYIMNGVLSKDNNNVDVLKLRDVVLKSELDTKIKCDFMSYLYTKQEKKVESFRVFVYDFFHAEQAVNRAKDCDTVEKWTSKMIEELKPSIKEYSRQQEELVLAMVLYEQTCREHSFNDLFCRFTEVYQTKGGIL